MADRETDKPEDGREDEDDLSGRFPDLESDARLRTPRGDLPSFPDVRFERPDAGKSDKRAGGDAWFGSDLRKMGAAGTIGTTLVAAIGVGTLLGWLADRYLIPGEGQWGLIVGFLLGTTAGFVQMIRIANELNRDDPKK